MSKWSSVRAAGWACLALTVSAAPARAADIYVPAGGNLQAALNQAQGGDTVLLEAGATYTGNFKLPVHAGLSYVTIRSAAPAALLPPTGVRMSPEYAAYLPKIKSSNTAAALRMAPGASFWRVMLIEFQANVKGYGAVIELGDGSVAQNDLSLVPHHVIVDRVLVRGDRLDGQKRGIGLNTAYTTIVNSYISDMKAVSQDSQAIGGWNGPGPYRIENNYLEAAGEVFMLGGDDPKIAGLTPSDLTFRRNTLTRPVSWKGPIVGAPANVRGSVATGGSLPAGTYGYKVVARRPVSSTTAKSPASTEFRVTVAAGARVALAWDPVPDASEYLVYGRTAGAQTMYWRVTTPSFTDAGMTGTAGTPSATGTVWQVKNLFELKNARRVLVQDNVMENVWAQAQAGFAILLTPRNQYGGCLWCVVEDVTFEGNVVRHMGAGIQVLGWDDEHPSQQTNTIVIRNNEFSDINRAAWGGDGYFLQLTDSPRNVTVDHNTVISSAGKGLIVVGGGTVDQFTFTNNIGRHDAYGIKGDGQATGNGTINYYLPGSVITRNVLAGGKASSYPAGNEFPTLTDFEAHFVDYPAANFALKPATNWEHAGTDGLDLGAYRRVGGEVLDPGAQPVAIATSVLAAVTEGDAYAATLSAQGGIEPYRWSLQGGALPSGVTLDAVSGLLSGTPTVPGDYTFTVAVEDAAGDGAARPLTMHVDVRIPPVEVLTQALPDAQATIAYAQALEAIGGLGPYVWSAISALPPGLSLSATGMLTGTPLVASTTPITVVATDAQDGTRRASRTLALTVVPAPNRLPTVSLSASASTVQAGAPVTLTASAVDPDGTVQRVDFYAGDALIGSVTGPTFQMTWTAVAGSYTFTAVATDNSNEWSRSAAVSVTTRRDVVIYGAQVARMVGRYSLAADAAAANGFGLLNPDANAAKVTTAAAAPASYAEFTFYAEAGTQYHLWLRGKAQRNSPYNDSLFAQFDNVADARIGTTSARSINLEEDAGVGLSGFGWQDDGYGRGVLGPAVVFERTGLQTIRLQPREDGLLIDQIVLSPETYLRAAPGATKDDTTILAR
jgi:hypothetical protein